MLSSLGAIRARRICWNPARRGWCHSDSSQPGCNWSNGEFVGRCCGSMGWRNRKSSTVNHGAHTRYSLGGHQYHPKYNKFWAGACFQLALLSHARPPKNDIYRYLKNHVLDSVEILLYQTVVLWTSSLIGPKVPNTNMWLWGKTLIAKRCPKS